MNLQRLLIFHAFATLAAAIALIISPNLIPGTVGIELDESQYLLSYLLGAAEASTAFLSFYASKLRNPEALRLISWSFIVFHVATGAVEVYAFMQGITPAIWGNIALRVIISALFAYYGVYKMPQQKPAA